jgi:hypothetical protein
MKTDIKIEYAVVYPEHTWQTVVGKDGVLYAHCTNCHCRRVERFKFGVWEGMQTAHPSTHEKCPAIRKQIDPWEGP